MNGDIFKTYITGYTYLILSINDIFLILNHFFN